MVKTLVDYLNVYLGTLGFRAEGIAEVRELDGNRWPALVGTTEYTPINIELPVIYHRILSGPRKGTEENDSPRYDDPIATLTWSMRAVAVFDNIYCQDTEEKVIRNLMAGLKLASTDAIAESLLISQVSFAGNNSERSLAAWDAEFGIDYDYSRKVVYVDYDIEAVGFESCFTVQGCEDDINVIDVIIGEYCTSETPVCDPALITTNSDSPALSVASGATQDITISNSAATAIGTRSGAAVTIADSAVTVNGSAYGSTPATVTGNVLVVDNTRTPTGSLNGVGEWEVPAGAGPVGATLMKTGQTVSYATGDDGDIQAGRDADFFTLPSNNPFGHTFRFTGITGGYSNNGFSSFLYYDVNGNITTLGLAFPENIMLDWSTFNGSTVLMYHARPSTLTAMNWADAMAFSLAYTTTSYASGWRNGNKFELFNLTQEGQSVGQWSMQWSPLEFTSLGFWTSTSVGQTPVNNAFCVFGLGTCINSAKTSLFRPWPVRTGTVTGTVIT